MSYKYVFVNVIYKNGNDLKQFIQNITKFEYSYKIIVVNNYYDESSKNEIKRIAEDGNCIFLENENNGYGAGNNVGIQYALDHLKFEYLIVSNSDINIIQFDDSSLKQSEVPAIYAPYLKTLNGKRQNPYWVHFNPLIVKVQYIADKHEIKLLDYFILALLKLDRFIFNKKVKSGGLKKIYACHGAFFIISRAAIKKLNVLYDKNMFLFYEEMLVGWKARKNGIPIYYDHDIKVQHLEDGSMKLANINQRKIAHKSVTYFYETYVMRKGRT